MTIRIEDDVPQAERAFAIGVMGQRYPTTTFLQLGRGLSDGEILQRLLVSAADWMGMYPVAIPVELPITVLPERKEWPRRAMLTFCPEA